MKEARYFRICSIVFLFVFLFISCQTQALSSEEESNLDKACFDVKTMKEPFIKSEVRNSRTNFSINNKGIMIQADAILGEFKTNFSSSSKFRKQNIRTAASKINLTVVYPHEEFSICEILVPFTEENGYLPAGTIVEGKVVNSFGGGVCQVSTTLYNAVLNAELVVLERHSHSIAVSYIEVGRDAAISENLKDFRFLNSLETPIIIEAITTQRDELIFRIRGISIKSNGKRAITLETVILEEIKAGEPVIEYDSSQPQDYIKVTQSAHNGYKVELYRVVVENGVEIKREKINYSEYEASPQYVVVGRKIL